MSLKYEPASEPQVEQSRELECILGLSFRGPWSLGILNLVDYFPTGSQAF